MLHTYKCMMYRITGNFNLFTHCYHGQNVYPANFFFALTVFNDYIEPMAAYTEWVKLNISGNATHVARVLMSAIMYMHILL